jgi:hypothetical protein
VDADHSPAERIIADLNTHDAYGRSLTPQGISEAVTAGQCIDMRARIGGRVEIRSRAQGGMEWAPWTWYHRTCARYAPEGTPADFYGGAPDWRTAWAYARRHMRNFHGVELGAAGWLTDGSV